MTYYKVLDENNQGIFSRADWFLPKGRRPGKWMPKVVGKLFICNTGYHLCRESDLAQWLGPNIYEIESKSEVVEVTGHTNKVLTAGPVRLVSKLDTWNDKSARLFAADCAEHVLYLFEDRYPQDERPRKAIKAARQFISGDITFDEMAAAWDAAWDAARATAGDAARAAAGAAAGYAAWAAAKATAWAAAGAAAGDAAWAAARAAERQWQTERLVEYLNGKR